MARKGMKEALANSLQAEDAAVRNRFEKADSLFGDRPESLPSPVETAPQPEKDDKSKVVRDSFTLPAQDYDLIAVIRGRCLASAVSVNKGEVVRAGLHALQQMSDTELLQIVEGLEKVKTGRPSGKA
jgi:hypothetical protein